MFCAARTDLVPLKKQFNIQTRTWVDLGLVIEKLEMGAFQRPKPTPKSIRQRVGLKTLVQRLFEVALPPFDWRKDWFKVTWSKVPKFQIKVIYASFQLPLDTETLTYSMRDSQSTIDCFLSLLMMHFNMRVSPNLWMEALEG